MASRGELPAGYAETETHNSRIYLMRLIHPQSVEDLDLSFRDRGRQRALEPHRLKIEIVATDKADKLGTLFLGRLSCQP